MEAAESCRDQKREQTEAVEGEIEGVGVKREEEPRKQGSERIFGVWREGAYVVSSYYTRIYWGEEESAEKVFSIV